MTENRYTDERYKRFFHTYDGDILKDFIAQHASKNKPDEVLDAMQKFSDTEQYMMHLPLEHGVILDEIVRTHKSARVLEIGGYCGYSAVRIARFLECGGTLTSMEKSKDSAPLMQWVTEYAGVSECVTIINKDAKVGIKDLRGVYDMVLLDHHKLHYQRDTEALLTRGLLADGCVIMADNVSRPNAKPFVDWALSHPQFERMPESVEDFLVVRYCA